MVCDITCNFLHIINETNATIAAMLKRSEEMLHRGAQTEPMIAAPRKRLGDSATIQNGSVVIPKWWLCVFTTVVSTRIIFAKLE
jgi:hypothetical protein